MKRFRKSALIFMLIACLGMLLVSCNSQETNTTSSDENENVTKDKPKEEAKDSDEKVTLEVMVAWDENMFNDRFKNPVEKKFPNITLKQVPGNNWDRADMEKQFSKGVSPDFFFTLGVDTIEYFNLEMDLDPFIKASNFDTSSINPVLFDQIRSADPEGRLLSWPYEYTYYAMLYNTDIFDLFGVPYPEDGMTWAETIELAKQLTGTRNGVDYRGLDIPGGIPIDQFSVTKTDPETGEVLITERDEFKRFLEMYESLFNIPGYGEEAFSEEMFLAGKTAMYVTNAQGLNWWKDTEGLNFDVAQTPSWSDLPNIAPRGFLHTLTMNPATEHPEEVFKVFSYFASDEYQLWMSQNGVGPVSTNTDILNQFYSDDTYEKVHDKNIPAIFKSTPAAPPEQASRWDGFVNLDLDRFKKEGLTPAEYLRIVKEESEAKILEEKNKE